jgi:hypothetical protein
MNYQDKNKFKITNNLITNITYKPQLIQLSNSLTLS